MDDMIFGRRYRVTEKLGTGGMAEVFKAVDETLGRTVAVKVLHPRYAADPSFAARFRQEAQAAANLQSPYIVNIYDWGQDGDTYYIVMELIRGNDLKSIIDTKGALDSRRVAEIGAQVCSALSVAHGYDIIHRDIKPHNIMVTPDGSVKVMDFGIARAGNTTMTQTGSVLGTAHYVSPEQAQGRDLKPTSDLYSLGIVLYEAATGKLPFDADTPVAVALKQVNEQPVRPSTINPAVSPDLERVIGRALAKDPLKRYSTAEEMRKDLLRIVTGEGVTGGNAFPVNGAAGGSDQTQVLPAVGGGYGSQPAIRAIPKRRPVWPWILLAGLLIVAGLGVAFQMGLLGKQGAPVPELVGLEQADAEARITESGFVLGDVIPAYDDAAKAGTVTDQSPVAKATAEKGSAIDITVSKGPKMVEVPQLVGLPSAEAQTALDELGLVGRSTLEPDAETEPGTVFHQDPTQGTTVREGSTVNFTVSRGVETVMVPDVSDKKKSVAEALLVKAGFKVAFTNQFDDKIAAGFVISQNPQGGLEVAKGSTVTVVVSKGPQSAAVPDVIGKTLAEAEAALKAVGFTATVSYESHANNGTVLEQDPRVGTILDTGSAVKLLVDGTAP